MAKFFVAKYDGKYIASTLILIYKNVAYEWYAGSSKNPKDLLLYPNDLLLWHAIESSHDNQLQTFDFGGGGLLGEENAGWVKFKREFGGELVNYGRYTMVHQPIKLWFSDRALTIYKKAFF